jgi:hypothetical protein
MNCTGDRTIDNGKIKKNCSLLLQHKASSHSPLTPPSNDDTICSFNIL